MRRVAVTGVGLVSCIGHDLDSVHDALRAGRSGVVAVPAWAEAGLTSTIAGMPIVSVERVTAADIPRLLGHGMSRAGTWCAVAAREAVRQSGLSAEELAEPGVGCFVGTGVGDLPAIHRAARLFDEGRARRAHPFTVLQAMSSSASASVGNLLGIRGRTYSISSACATSAHSIGHGFELVRAGVLDRAVVGGGEDVNELMTAGFGAMRLALSTHYNDAPNRASRPFDVDRDGFVMGGGAGILVLEEESAARRRGAEVLGEIVGYGATADAHDMVLPHVDGLGPAAAMTLALDDAELGPAEIGYLNTHGTSTPAGDVAELRAIRRVFGDHVPPFSSTKSLTGHGLGAAGALETIYCMAMLRRSFVAPSINVDTPDPEVEDLPLVVSARSEQLEYAMTNSFGFGGTNAVLIVRASGV